MPPRIGRRPRNQAPNPVANQAPNPIANPTANPIRQPPPTTDAEVNTDE